jgi:hypothetical protein
MSRYLRWSVGGWSMSSVRSVVTGLCALDGFAASAAAAAAARNASRRGTAVAGVSMRVALCCMACNGGPRGVLSDATHAASSVMLCMMRSRAVLNCYHSFWTVIARLNN